MQLNFIHDVTGFNPMTYFHDIKALNYEMRTMNQKHVTYSAFIVMQHDAQSSHAVYLLIHILSACLSCL